MPQYREKHHASACDVHFKRGPEMEVCSCAVAEVVRLLAELKTSADVAITASNQAVKYMEERDALNEKIVAIVKAANESGWDGVNNSKILPEFIRGLARDLKAAVTKADDWKATLDMYAKAWWRELRGPYWNKTHEIDALVLTTRDRMEEVDKTRAAIKAEKERADKAEQALERVIAAVASSGC